MGSYSEMNGDSGIPREYNPRYLGPRYYIKFPGVQTKERSQQLHHYIYIKSLLTSGKMAA